MKRLLSALASATALALVMCPPAFADDDDDDYTPITDCGTVITEPGHYKLMNDLVGCDVPDPMGDTIEYGIGIFSDDVVLDLNDHAISCLHGDQQGSNFYNFGVFTQEFRARIEIFDGAVTGCNIGVIMNQSVDSSVKHMTVAGNVIGIELLSGSDVLVKHNRVIGSTFEGIFGFPFFLGNYLGPGTNHQVHKNLVLDSGSSGILGVGIEDTVISCNRSDRNYDGVVLLTGGPGIPLRNTVKNNVMNNNVDTGIAVIGRAWDDFVFGPIPFDNTFKGNTALNNPLGDLFEMVFDFADGRFEPHPDGLCPNSWKKNTYGTAVAAEGCIAPSTYFDDDDDEDGCAPRLEDADDDENPLKDPGFELQLPPEQGGWVVFAPGSSWFTTDRARSGSWSFLNTAFLGVTGSVQEFPAEAGSLWRLTGYGLTATRLPDGPVFGIVQFSFFDEFGGDIGTVETAGWMFPALTSNQINAGSMIDRWIFLDTGIGTAPEGTATIRAFTLYVDFAEFPGTGVYFDDLKLCELAEDGDALECKELGDDDDDDSDSDSDSDSDDDD